ncbi:hypothetical protein [Aeropyrum pernix]|nr:hypothetical protein [Aeropyrum pernix]
MAREGRYVFTFTARKRKKPYYRYEGILRTHRFYIEYYSLLEGQEPSRAAGNGEARIAFPVRFMELVLDFSRELGGETVEVRMSKIRGQNLYYEKPIVLLPNEVAFRRHLLFAVTVSTYKKPLEARFNALRNLLLTMNANLINILSTIVMDRYRELKASSNPAWHWHMLRVGRAVKVLYKLD